jgi:hypothetical protein
VCAAGVRTRREDSLKKLGPEMSGQEDFVQDLKFVDRDEIDLGLQEHQVFESSPKVGYTASSRTGRERGLPEWTGRGRRLQHGVPGCRGRKTQGWVSK